MNVSSYIFDFFYKKGVTTVFQLVGGGSMYLNDAVSKSKMDVYNCNHEQACAYAAIGYTKVTGIPSLVLVTTGCGATNTITGLLDAWQDSVPVIFISGQVRTSDINNDLRQSGVQGANIGPIVKSIVKYYYLINQYNLNKFINEEGTALEYLLNESYNKCISDRKGPVWIECPIDIQKEEI